MRLEEIGFEPGDREKQEVYADRIEVFPEGSLVACINNECIGFIFSEIWNECITFSPADFMLGHDIRKCHSKEKGTELYLSSMTIDPQFRGKGFGSLLLSNCIAS